MNRGDVVTAAAVFTLVTGAGFGAAALTAPGVPVRHPAATVTIRVTTPAWHPVVSEFQPSSEPQVPASLLADHATTGPGPVAPVPSPAPGPTQRPAPAVCLVRVTSLQICLGGVS